jgi:hypothetical protein
MAIPAFRSNLFEAEKASKRISTSIGSNRQRIESKIRSKNLKNLKNQMNQQKSATSPKSAFHIVIK